MIYNVIIILCGMYSSILNNVLIVSVLFFIPTSSSFFERKFLLKEIKAESGCIINWVFQLAYSWERHNYSSLVERERERERGRGRGRGRERWRRKGRERKREVGHNADHE